MRQKRDWHRFEDAIVFCLTLTCMFVQVHRLYESGHYEDVVQLLMPTLYQPQPKTKVRSYSIEYLQYDA